MDTTVSSFRLSISFSISIYVPKDDMYVYIRAGARDVQDNDQPAGELVASLRVQTSSRKTPSQAFLSQTFHPIPSAVRAVALHSTGTSSEQSARSPDNDDNVTASPQPKRRHADTFNTSGTFDTFAQWTIPRRRPRRRQCAFGAHGGPFMRWWQTGYAPWMIYSYIPLFPTPIFFSQGGTALTLLFYSSAGLRTVGGGG